jgi:predicted nucleic acid-binding protein
MAADFIDANIFLRHLVQDQPTQSPRATAYLNRVDQGQVDAETSAAVMAEVIFTLERTYRTPKPRIRELVLALLEIAGMSVPDGTAVREALDIYVGRNVSYGDAFTAVLMERRGLSEIVSFDRDFDRIPGVTRTEP